MTPETPTPAILKLGPCRIGFHAWGRWRDDPDSKERDTYCDISVQERRCSRCGQLARRSERISLA